MEGVKLATRLVLPADQCSQAIRGLRITVSHKSLFLSSTGFASHGIYDSVTFPHMDQFARWTKARESQRANQNTKAGYE